MTLSEKQIQALNNMSNTARDAGLGDLLAKLEGKSGGGEIQKIIAKIEKELDDSNALVMEIEEGLKSETDKIKVDMSQLSNKLNDLANSVSSQFAEISRKIEEIKSIKSEPVAPLVVSKRIAPEVNPIDEAPSGLA